MKVALPVAFASLLLFFAIGASRVNVSDNISDAMLAHDTESFELYRDYLTRFPSDVTAIIVVEGRVCTAEGWQLVRDLEASLSSHPLVDKTISIASSSALYALGDVDTVTLDSFAETPFTNSSQRCKAAAEYPPFSEILVTKDGNTVAMIAIAEHEADPNLFAAAVESVKSQFVFQASEIGANILLTGDPVMSAAIAGAISRDLTYIIGLVALLLAATLLITRSPITCLASFLTMLFAIVGAFGGMGWLGIDLTPGTSLSIFLLAPLSAAFVIHAHGYAFRSTTRALIPREGIMPTAFAGFTTATLFACTGLTPSPDVQALAQVGSFGILCATVAVFLVAFPLLSASSKLRYAVDFSIPRWAFVRPWIAYALLAFFVIAAGIGLSKARFEYEAVDYLPASNPYRAEFERIGKSFGRMTIPLMVEVPGSISQPEFWKDLDAALKEVQKNQATPVQMSWFYTQMGALTRAFTAGTEDFPPDQATFEQLFVWFDPADYESYIDEGSERIVVLINVPFIGSQDYYFLKEAIARSLAKSGLEGDLVGRVSGFFETGHRVGVDNLKSLAIGGALVFCLLLVAFKSFVMSAIAIFVNALPALTSLSALGLMGVPIDLGSSIVTAMAFGIVVDDSTHLLIRIRNLQRSGYDPSTAVLRAIREMIAPIMATTLTMSAGFCVLFLAELQPFQDFAITILIALSTALLADLVFLPVLVRTFLKDKLVTTSRLV